jgi:MraZ protein
MAAQPCIFSGQDFSLQRDKNRFVLPAQFRKTLRESNGGKSAMLLVKHDRWECLVGFGHSRVEELAAQLDREEELAARAGKEFDKEKRSLDLYTFEEVPFDGSGRFILPDNLAAMARIERRIFFQGGGAFFTMWSPDELGKMGADWANAQTACANLAAKELAKAGKA